MISLIGGKLTTYRNVGEEMTDAVLKKMKRAHKSSQTASLPLPGYIVADDERIAQAIADYSSLLSPRTINHLFSVYGARALELLSLTREHPELAQPIGNSLPDIKAQIVYAVQHEYAHALTDIMRRRTMLAMDGNYGLDLLPVVTETLQDYCSWSQERCDRAVADYKTYMEQNCIPDFQLPRLEHQFA